MHRRRGRRRRRPRLGRAPPPSTPATPGIACAPGSLPEQTQGRAPLADVATGRYAKGYTCNVTEVSHTGRTGGYRVERYVDSSGNECASYDTTLLWPTAAADQGTNGPGTYVLDMKDPAKPVITAVLRSPAFQSPHESVRLNQKRGLLAAVMAYPTTQPGQVDVYDVSQDCRTPQLMSSTAMGVLGHEGGFAPDGLTYYVGSLYFRTLTAVDLTDPRTPKPVWTTTDYEPHGVSISADGNTLYMAGAGFDDSGFSGLTVLDVTQVQKRVPNPEVPVVSRTTWDTVSTPQNATPFTSGGKPYVFEIDEFGSGAQIGAARIISMKDPKKPKVVSDLRLEVNREELQGDDLENHAAEGRLVRDVGAGLRREDGRHLVLRRQHRVLRRTSHRPGQAHPVRRLHGAARELTRVVRGGCWRATSRLCDEKRTRSCCLSSFRHGDCLQQHAP